MSDKSNIEWTDATWNPLRGTIGRHHCVRISEGCKHCYAAAMNHRFKGPDYVVGADVPRLDNEALLQPLKWKKPRRIFVCSMTDLFMDEHTDEMIDRVFAAIAWSRHHIYQILTKRSRRMREYSVGMLALSPRDRTRRLVGAMYGRKMGEHQTDGVGELLWPFPWVWLGVSAENQARADERIPDLLATPAAVRFVSAEPLIGPLNLRSACARSSMWMPSEGGHTFGTWHRGLPIADALKFLDWVIVGGESGPKARPCNVSWIRSIKDQCQAAGVPVFVKQLGSRPHDGVYGHSDDPRWKPLERWIRSKDRKGGDPAEWPASLRVREMPR